MIRVMSRLVLLCAALGVRGAGSWPLSPVPNPAVPAPTQRPDANADAAQPTPSPAFPSALFTAAFSSTTKSEHVRLPHDDASCPIPPGRWLHTATYIAGSVFVFGGVDAVSTTRLHQALAGDAAGNVSSPAADALLNDVWSYSTGPGSWRRIQADTVPCLGPILAGPALEAAAARTPYYRPQNVPAAPRVRQEPPASAMEDAVTAAAEHKLPERAILLAPLPPPVPSLSDLAPAGGAAGAGAGGAAEEGPGAPAALFVELGGEQKGSQAATAPPLLQSLSRADRYRRVLGLHVDVDDSWRPPAAASAAAAPSPANHAALLSPPVVLAELHASARRRAGLSARSSLRERRRLVSQRGALEAWGADRSPTSASAAAPRAAPLSGDSSDAVVLGGVGDAALPSRVAAPASTVSAAPPASSAAAPRQGTTKSAAKEGRPEYSVLPAPPLVSLEPSDALWQYDLASLRWLQPASDPRPTVAVTMERIRDGEVVVPSSVPVAVEHELRGQAEAVARLQLARAAWPPPPHPSAVLPGLKLGWMPPPPQPRLVPTSVLRGSNRMRAAAGAPPARHPAPPASGAPAVSAAQGGDALRRDGTDSLVLAELSACAGGSEPPSAQLRLDAGVARPLLAPVPRWLHSAVVMARGIVVFGGVASSLRGSSAVRSGHAVLGDAWHFDPEPPRETTEEEQAEEAEPPQPFGAQARGRVWTPLWPPTPTPSPSAMSQTPPPPSNAPPSGPWSFIDILLPRSCAVSSEETGGVLSYVPPMEGHSAVVVRAPAPLPSRNVPARPPLYLLSQMASIPSGAAVLGPWLGRALQHLERSDPAAAADAFWGLFGGDSWAARRAWESPARVDALLEALGAGGGGGGGGGGGSGGKKGSSSKQPRGKGKGGKAPAKASDKGSKGGVEVMLVYGGVVSEHPPLLTLALQAPSPAPAAAEEEGGDAPPPRPPGPQVLSPYGADGRDGRVWAFTAEPEPAWTVHYPLPGAPAPPARWLHSAVTVTLGDAPAAADGADEGGAPAGGKGARSKSRFAAAASPRGGWDGGGGGGGGRGVGGMSPRFAASSDSVVQGKGSKGRGGGSKGGGKGKGGGATDSGDSGSGGGEQYMVIFGGCGLHLEALNDVWLYRFSDNSWRELLPHGYGPSPRWLAAAAAVLPPRVLEAPRLGPELVMPPGSYYERMAASAHPELVGTGADAADLA